MFSLLWLASSVGFIIGAIKYIIENRNTGVSMSSIAVELIGIIALVLWIITNIKKDFIC